MTSYTEISCELDGTVATVTLDRPANLNAITPRMLGELNDCFASLAARSELAVVVLTGAGRVFSAGVDLKALGERTLTDGKVGDILDVPARELTARITDLDKVVVAKVNGHCFTGALELALACDLMAVADEALIGDTHAKFGLRPTWGMSARLPATVGRSAAKLLSYTGRSITGADALRLGMAAICVPREQLDDAVQDLVAEIAANSHGSLAAYKDLYRAGTGRSVSDAMAYEYGVEYPIADTEERLAPWR